MSPLWRLSNSPKMATPSVPSCRVCFSFKQNDLHIVKNRSVQHDSFCNSLVTVSSQEVEWFVFLFSTGKKDSSSDSDSQAQDLAHSRCLKKVWSVIFFSFNSVAQHALSIFPWLNTTETEKVKMAKDSLLSNSQLVMKSISSCSGLNLHYIVHANMWMLFPY